MKYGLLVFLASCAVTRVELVPPAIGHGTIDVKVVATSWNEYEDDDWYDSYELELTNPAAAPVDVPLREIRLIAVSMLDGARFESAPRNAGFGELPSSRAEPDQVPEFLRVGAGQTARVWVAFGGKKRDPRSRLIRMSLLRVPGAGDIVLDTRTPDHALGIRQYWGKRRAAGLALRPYVDTGHHHRAVPVPFMTAISFLSCQLEYDVHAGYQVFYDAENGHYDRSSGFVGGGSATWHFSRVLGIYGDVDYERRSGTNGMAVGGGVALMLFDRDHGDPFKGFYEPNVQFRIGWVETFANGDRWGALRTGFEIASWSLY